MSSLARPNQVADALRVEERGERDPAARIIEASLDPMIVGDDENNVLFANRPACEMLGYEASELEGLGAAELAWDPQPVDEQWREFRRTGSVRGVWSLRHRSGRRVDVRISAIADVVPGRHLSIMHDITEERETRSRLALQAELLDQLDAAVIASNVDARISLWSAGAERIFGHPRADAIGATGEQLGLAPRRAEGIVRALFDRIRAGEEHLQAELPMRRANGEEFPAVGRVSAWRDGDGGLLGAASVVVDISEQRRAEREIELRTEQQAAIADLGRRQIAGTPAAELMGLAVERCRELLGADLVRVAVVEEGSDAATVRAAAGWPPGTVGATVDLGTTMPGVSFASEGPLVSEDVAADPRFDDEALVAAGVASGMSCQIPGKAGPYGVLGLHSLSRRSFEAEELNFVQSIAHVLGAAVARDRERDLEEQLERTRRLEAIGQLAGGVAHDFNNLLAVILNYAALVRDRLSAGGVLKTEYLQEIEEAGRQAAALTGQLLVFSRHSGVKRIAVDVNGVVERSLSLLRRTLGEQIELRSELGAGLPAISLGEGQLEQIVMNLALNARDACRNGGVVTLRTREGSGAPGAATERGDGRAVVIEIADSGVGMDAETARRAFDPFFTTKAAGQGTGLGLATVYGIVSEAGGEVAIESEPGRGTLVRVRLPAASADPATAEIEAAEDGDHGRAQHGQGRSVLVVEDDDRLRRLAELVLSDAGYEALGVAGGSEALALEQESLAAVDVVLTDVVMPRISGPELVERLRERGSAAKVVFMSGYTGEAVSRAGLAEAGAELVAKPFHRAELLAAVARAIEGGDDG